MFEKDCDVNCNRVQRIASNNVNNPVTAKNRNNVFTPLTPTNPVNKLTNDVTRVATAVFGCRPHKAGAIAHHQQSPRPKPAYRTPTESPSKRAFPNKRVRQHALFAPSSGRFCFQRLPESVGSAVMRFGREQGMFERVHCPRAEGFWSGAFVVICSSATSVTCVAIYGGVTLCLAIAGLHKGGSSRRQLFSSFCF